MSLTFGETVGAVLFLCCVAMAAVLIDRRNEVHRWEDDR